MPQRKTTIRDVARRLGMSVATVSKALNNYPDVNQNTRRRVFDVAKELNFTPNQQAVNLRKKSTKLIGLVLPRLSHYYFSSLAEAIIELAAKDEIGVIVQPTFENFTKEKSVLAHLVKRNVDGILISLSNETRTPDHLIELHQRGISIVEFDSISKLSPFDKVVNSNREAAKSVVEHLISRGKKTIAHLRGPLLSQNSIDRFLGYKTAIEEGGLVFDNQLVVQVNPNNLTQSKMAFCQLYDQRPDIDAVFALTDIAAVGALEELKNRAIAVPDQVAVVGFSNWQLSSLVTPRLTTIDQNVSQMAKTAYELLKKNIKDRDLKKRESEYIYVETRLIVRDSS